MLVTRRLEIAAPILVSLTVLRAKVQFMALDEGNLAMVTYRDGTVNSGEPS
jgi:hypothetical protein